MNYFMFLSLTRKNVYGGIVMFWVRFRSSVILSIITILMLVLGGNYLFGAVAIISIIGLRELYRTVDTHKSILGFVGYFAGISYYALLYFQVKNFATIVSVLFLLLLLLCYVVTFPKYKTEQVLLTFFGLFYVVMMLSYIYQVRILENGAILVWLIFICSWGSDTCAYCVGMAIGKKKIFPKLSPKKSLEGCIGGILGSALLGFIYGTILKEHVTIVSHPQIAFTLIGAAGSVISQIGDLAASAIKRNYDIKDYGKLIPGHGGILDRFDSIIVTAPIVYYLAVLL